MPGTDGVSATRTITASRPSTRILVLTTFDDDDHLYPSREAGACGFLAKSAAPDLLLESIRRAADGDSPFSPHLLLRVVWPTVRSNQIRWSN
ncbi:response regulator [Rhodococcus opacus]|uniref:response regulator n=1 Tax=Rhodococcus opacus TaxID=37919 RepID=UPI0029541A8E|nr:response regulator transcription factor [Rhodococcus opacus]MDV7090917.1 response regulator transcription factor [Rhodococcus opacus]